MKPKFLRTDLFHAELTKRTERTFLLRRRVYRCKWEEGFEFVDRDGRRCRPTQREYDSDGASVPHPLDWLVPALEAFRYREATMGIHDPACRDGKLEKWDEENLRWVVVDVPRSVADDLLKQGVEALGGWWITRWAYWLGVRIGSGFRR